ncbi:hypothetical protein WJX81_000538 [Elliptochloris bilobata]|uniref:Uncharacterized protein n=1 Tax=Elliptochloris bilobata TaxID=381761 RepID=A0AAW1R2T1_9CHLO
MTARSPLLQAWDSFCHRVRECGKHPQVPWKAYLITLPGDEAKADFSLAQLRRLGLEVEVVHGINSTQAGPPDKYAECLPAGAATDCQFGLTLAHRNVWHAIAAAKHGAAWVFEDDFVLHDDFLSLFPHYWASVPVGFDYVVVGQIPRHFDTGNFTVEAAPELLPWGTHAYIISAAQAERMGRLVDLMVARSAHPVDDMHTTTWQLDGEDVKIDHFLSLVYSNLTLAADRSRWLVFDSPPDTPFRLGNVSWARHGGCECSCDNIEQCARYGLAPAVGVGLAAQHICRRNVDQVVRWQETLPPLIAGGRVQPCSDLRSCGAFVCSWEELYGLLSPFPQGFNAMRATRARSASAKPPASKSAAAVAEPAAAAAKQAKRLRVAAPRGPARAHRAVGRSAAALDGLVPSAPIVLGSSLSGSDLAGSGSSDDEDSSSEDGLPVGRNGRAPASDEVVDMTEDASDADVPPAPAAAGGKPARAPRSRAAPRAARRRGHGRGAGRGRGRAAAAAGDGGPGSPTGGAGTAASPGGMLSPGNVWGPYDSDDEPKEPLDDSLVKKVMPEMEPPPELLMPLLPYQKEFLAWAIKQEQSDVRGGILADEMGMGKTIQAISVIVTHRTDDMSRLPPVTPAAGAAPCASAAAALRPRLALPGAPPREDPTPDLAAAGPSGSDAGVDHDPDPAAAEPSGSAAPCAVPRGRGKAAAAGGASSSRDKAAGSSCAGPSCSSAAAAASGGAPCGSGGACGAAAGSADPVGDPAGGGYGRATLVICPLVAVIQWGKEIERFVAPNTLKVVRYHGPKRTADPAVLANADLVLTTYSIAENEFRRFMQPGKVPCGYCGKKFYPERLKVHLRFFCGPNAHKSAALAKQQKKRPRGDQKQAAPAAAAAAAAGDSESDAELGPDSDDEDEGTNPKPTHSDNVGLGAAVRNVLRAMGAAPSGAAEGRHGMQPLKAVDKGGKAGGKKAGGKTAKRAKGAAGGGKAAGGKGKAAAGKGKGAAKGKGKAAAADPDFSDGSDDSGDSDFEADDDEEEEEGEETAVGPTSPFGGRGGWRWMSGGGRDCADKEAETMIAAAEKVAAEKAGRSSDVPAISVLHNVKWRRVVLDEAHSIKDRRCSTARSVFALDAKYKWALSGTPLQNRVGELYSLVRFLRIYPYAFYFCNSGRSKHAAGKPCDCRSLDHPFKRNRRQCDHCGHSPLHHFCWWNKFIANPIKKFGYVGKGKTAMSLLKNEIMDKILLRRTKLQCADVLALPPRTVTLRKDRFDASEQDFYEALYTQSQAQFGEYIQAGTVLNNYAHVFELLIRLRQAVDHPYLVVHSTTGANGGVGAGSATDANKALGTGGGDRGVCAICHDPVEDAVGAACGHTFCRACTVEYTGACVGPARCPSCHKALNIDLSTTAPVRVVGSRKNSIINRICLSEFHSSTKIEAVREELARMLARDPAAKALIFSQFTSMLDLVAFRLDQVGVRCVRLEGSMSMEARDRMIDAFTNDPAVTVFLMSLKAGGVALNLTAASHVMLLDPWWNPAVEAQAQDRIHRLGQHKPIDVTRFVIGGTIEERILKLQEKKRLVFEGTVGKDAEALGRLTEDDLRFLFA